MAALRLYPVVTGNTRCAEVDTILPLGGGDDGKSPLFIPKGQAVQWSLYTMHRRKEFYGEDAEEFKPERWEKLRPGWVRVSEKARQYHCFWMLTTSRNTFLSTADLESALDNNLRSPKLATRLSD